jgi:Ca2+-binding RTX toxin-like protein
MPKLLQDIKHDLLKINIVEKTGNFLSQLPSTFTDLTDDLTGSGITSIHVPSIQTSYLVVYDPHFNAFTSADPNANYITVSGDHGSDVQGGNGSDIMLGGLGNDILGGGFGTNTLWGGAGDDQLYGFQHTNSTNVDISQIGGTFGFTYHAGEEYLFGGAGNDLLAGVLGTAFFNVSNGTLVFDISEGHKFLYGGDGNDMVLGSCYSSDNEITNVHATSLSGPSIVPDGPATVDGGNGNDFVSADFFNCVFHFTNATGNLIESVEDSVVTGGAGDDILIGSFGGSRECIYDGGSGTCLEIGANSLLDGGTGNDLVIGDMQACSELVIPAATSFTVDCHFGNSTLIGGVGNDTLIGDVQWAGFHYLLDASNVPILDANGNPTIVAGALDATTFGGDNILYGGAGNDLLVGGNQNGPAATVLGHNEFVFDGLINNGHDEILDFNVANDTLVGQHGAKFSDGGLVGGNLVINVHDAGINSTITLANIHTDIFNAIVQSHATVV